MSDRDAITQDGPFAPGQLAMPFYSDAHRALAGELQEWVRREADTIARIAARAVPDAAVQMVQALAGDGWLRVATERDMRSICLCRQAFAWIEDLCDFAFSLQALTAHPLKCVGRQDLVADLGAGRLIGALALTERGAGSDLASVATEARRTPDGYALYGDKAWIGHAGVASLLVVLARTGGAGAFGLSLFAVPGDATGVRQEHGPDMIAPRALGRLGFDGVEVGEDSLVGVAGHGFVHAVQTIEAFRMTVGAAANGFARAALQAAVRFTVARPVKDGLLADKQLVQAALADMHVAQNAAALAVAQAAWEWDTGQPTAVLRSSAAKLLATESAHAVVDQGVQLLGAEGVAANGPTERLYRQVRSLRIYEGTSEMQRLTIGQGVASGLI